jgi:hypothetical protein
LVKSLLIELDSPNILIFLPAINILRNFIDLRNDLNLPLAVINQLFLSLANKFKNKNELD